MSTRSCIAGTRIHRELLDRFEMDEDRPTIVVEEFDMRAFEHVVLEGSEALTYRRPGWELHE
jgi:hypothetical protein